MSCPWNPDALLSAAQDENEFFRYCAGVAYEMSQRSEISRGINIHITAMDLPLKKGVSSSAAVCVLVAKAFDLVYELGFLPHELMEIAYRGEILTGSKCGKMDQACVYGKVPVLLTFQKGAEVRIEPVFSAKEINLFFVDLAGKKNTVKILADLQGAYLGSEKLQWILGEENERIIRLAYRAVNSGDAEQLGRLMVEAQHNFDQFVAPHSPEELRSPLLHELLVFGDIAEHIYGGKGVGSQGDGTAQFVARSRADRDAAMVKIKEIFPQMRCFPLAIVENAPQRSLVS